MAERAQMVRQLRSQRTSFIIFSTAFLVIVLIALMVLSYRSQNRVRSVLQKEYESLITNDAESLGGAINAQLSELETELRLAAEYRDIKSLDPEVCTAKLEEIQKTVGSQLGNVARLGPDRIFYCSLNKQLLGTSGSALGSYVDNIFNDPEHKPVKSRILNPKGSKEHLIAIHVPVYDLQDNFVGTLGGAVALETLGRELLNQAKPSRNGFMILLDDNGDILYHPREEFIGKSIDDEVIKNYFEDNQIVFDSFRTAAKGTASTVTYVAGEEPRFASHVPFEIEPGRRFVVGAVVPRSDIAELTNDLKIVSSTLIVGAWFFGIFFFILLILYLYLNSKVFAPIEKISLAATNIAQGRETSINIKSGGREIQSLQRALNAMVDKLRGYSVNLEREVKEKTAQIEKSFQLAKEQNKSLNDAKLAITNVLEDLNIEKKEIEIEKAKAEALLSSIGDGVFVVDQDRKIVLFNQAACQITGLKESQAVGKRFDEVLKFTLEENGEKNDQFVDRAFTGVKTSMTNHTVVERADGVKVPVADSAAPVFGEGNKVTGVIVVFRDVSQEREVDRAKEEFLSLASHQLRTPATAVKQYLGLITDGYVSEEKEKDQLVADAYKSNNEQLQIIDDILSVAKIDAGKLEIKLEEADIKEVVEHAVKELTPLAKQKGHKLEVKLPAKGHKFNMDNLKITMSIQNLISNALKYTKGKGLIKVELSTDKDWVIIKVADNGIGIKDKDKKDLFQKFGRIQTDMTAKVQGTGLGLYLVKEFVAMHKGSIDVSDNKPKGTVFTIKLPTK